MTERCEGCGAEFDVNSGPTHRYMTSAAGCWAEYGEVLAILATEARLQPALVMCVDAYAVQHPGTPNPQSIQSVAIHLLNMHGYLVRGRAIAPPRLVKHKGAFRWLSPPSEAAASTVLEMPRSGSTAELISGARTWAEAAWSAWASHHAQIGAWTAQNADDDSTPIRVFFALAGRVVAYLSRRDHGAARPRGTRGRGSRFEDQPVVRIGVGGLRWQSRVCGGTTAPPGSWMK